MYLPENIQKITDDPVLSASRLFAAVAVGAVVLYALPAALILKLPILGLIIEWVAAQIPSISRWVELSTFPESTKVFAVFICFLIPIQVLLIARSDVARRIFVSKENVHSLKRLVVNFLRFFSLAWCCLYWVRCSRLLTLRHAEFV